MRLRRRDVGLFDPNQVRVLQRGLHVSLLDLNFFVAILARLVGLLHRRFHRQQRFFRRVAHFDQRRRMPRLLNRLGHDQSDILPGVMDAIVAQRKTFFIADAAASAAFLFLRGIFELRHVEVGEDGELLLSDVLPDESALTPEEGAVGSIAVNEIREVMAEVLTQRERTVLALRCGLDGSGPATVDEVSRRLGVTRERARQIEIKALRKVRPLVAALLSSTS